VDEGDLSSPEYVKVRKSQRTDVQRWLKREKKMKVAGLESFISRITSSHQHLMHMLCTHMAGGANLQTGLVSADNERDANIMQLAGVRAHPLSLAGIGGRNMYMLVRE
jgi:hypothetical protein